MQTGCFKEIDVQHEIIKLHCINEFQFNNKDIARSSRVARFLAAKYGRLLSIRDVRQGQCDAISRVCVCLFRSSNYGRILAVCEIFSAKEWCNLENRV